MIKKYHYSNILPRLNKHFIGFYLGDKLVGTVTLGWGTRPLHTIRKIFPSLETKDYYEIGRMCMTEEMPRNSESQMLSQLISYIKEHYPEIKVLFTWADGMVGKPGYVYQAANFWYLGYIWTDMYMKDGIKIHPRQTKQFFSNGEEDKRLSVRPTLEQMNQLNITHFKGKQFKYVYFLCDKKTQRALKEECTESLSKNYPKEKDLKWKEKTKEGKWIECNRPPYKTDMDTATREITGLNVVKKGTAT